MNTFWGRFMFFVDVTDPRTLFVSKAELESSKQAIEVSVCTKAALLQRIRCSQRQG